MKTIVPIVKISPILCPNCYNNTIVAYDKKDERINIGLYLKYKTTEDMIKYIKNNELKYMRCDKCKRKFIINWTSKDNLPYPMIDNKYNEFER